MLKESFIKICLSGKNCLLSDRKNCLLYEESEIREAWADYFEELATPVNHENYDQAHKLIVEKDVRNLHNLFTDGKIENIEPVTEEVVEEIILSFKNGKSPDEMHMTAEHLKYGGSRLFYILSFIINFLFKNIHIPSMFKSGIVCPVFKNGGKPKDDHNSYRKITITSCVGKVVEKIHLSRNENRILSVQNKLQKGFTKGEIPSIAGLILTELCNDAIKRKSSLYIALMDARKAFDVLWHLGLLREMNKAGFEGDNLRFFENWYTDLTSKIKWSRLLLHKIVEKQGVRQGGIWSPSAYKLYVNSLLDIFRRIK